MAPCPSPASYTPEQDTVATAAHNIIYNIIYNSKHTILLINSVGLNSWEAYTNALPWRHYTVFLLPIHTKPLSKSIVMSVIVTHFLHCDWMYAYFLYCDWMYAYFLCCD